MPGGRPSKYISHVKSKLEIIRAWRRRGLTEENIAVRLGVSRDALNEYKKQYSELYDVLKTGLDEGVAEVENAHYKAALGYEYEERKLVYDVDEYGKISTKPSRVEVVKKQAAPSITAQIFILKNRAGRGDRENGWHDKQEIVGAFAHGLYDGETIEALQAEAEKLSGIIGTGSFKTSDNRAGSADSTHSDSEGDSDTQGKE